MVIGLGEAVGNGYSEVTWLRGEPGLLLLYRHFTNNLIGSVIRLSPVYVRLAGDATEGSL